MPLKMTSEVSIVDVFAIGGLLLGGAAVFFGYGVDIKSNTTDIAHIKTDLVRIERTADANDAKILEQLKQQNEQMREIRIESAKGRIRIEDKLDKLIEREINNGGRQ